MIMYLLVAVLAIVIFYFVVKAAVRNGINESDLVKKEKPAADVEPVDPSKMGMSDRLAHALRE